MSRKFTNTQNWGNSIGVEISVGTKFKAGLPLIGKSEVEVSVNTSYEHTWGKEESTEVSYSLEVPCKAPPKTRVECKYVANQAKFTVPYTMYLERLNSAPKVISGTWTGVQTYHDRVEYNEFTKSG